MKIDLFKLNNYNKVDIDEDISFNEEFFANSEIRDIKNAHVKGTISIDYQDEVFLNLEVTGTMILPCAITLVDVNYDFMTNIEENYGNFQEIYNKSKNSLDILPFIWENIVSEVPIRVVAPGVNTQNIKGDGWELISDE